MRKGLIISAALVLILTSLTFAEEGNVSGSVSIGIRSVDVDPDSARFLKYKDLTGGAFGNIYLNYDSEDFFATVRGNNVGQDDQYYSLTGGKWGLFKIKLYYNEIPHNYSFNSRTFYSGIGSDNLVFSNISSTFPAVPDPAYWSNLDYKIKRKDLGATIDLTFNSPFYITLSANRLSRDGLYPIGAPSGVFRTGATSGSPFGNVVEMPAPIDNATNNAGIELGYRTKQLFLSLSGHYSEFDTNHEWLNFRNPYVVDRVLMETISLPPDNKYYKIKFTGSVKLPLDTTLAVNASTSKLTSDVALLDTIWTSTLPGPNYALTTLGLNDSTFNGEVVYKNFAAVLTSSPVKSLTTKVYYKYLNKDNNSDEITYTSGSTSVTNHLFEYKKNNAGIEIGYKFMKDLKASVGYDYLKIKRERDDIPETEDNTYFIQVKYTPLDFIGGRIKYQRLERDSTFESPGVASTDPAYIENFVRRFDATAKKQDSVRVSVDISPINALDVTAEYVYKKDKYDETILGMTENRRDEYILDASYEMKPIKIYGYIDYEEVKTDQSGRYINPSGTYSFDPNTAPVNNSYNWDVNLKDKNIAYGIGVEFSVLPNKLAIALQYDYQKSNGNADYTSQILTGTLTQDSIDIGAYDDYKLNSFSAKLKYNLTKKLKFILGYLYEKYTYNDAQFDGYGNIVGTPPNTYLTGAYADESYKANIVYLKTVYTF